MQATLVTLAKQHYKFTLYQLETYYSEDFKRTRTWGDNSIYFEEKTWVNESSYKKVFSLDFHDERALKKFLKQRYKNQSSFYFCTNLGYAIKNNNVHNASEWISIISTATNEKTIFFQLKERKKVNKFPKKKKCRYSDYYKSDYDWMAREIKAKKINQFIMDINEL